MQREIDFGKGFESTEAAEKVVAEVNELIQEFSHAASEATKLSKELQLENEKLAIEVKNLTNASADFATSIKGIHIMLTAHSDIIDKVPELKAYRQELSKLVMDSSMIKLGVIAQKNDEAKND